MAEATESGAGGSQASAPAVPSPGSRLQEARAQSGMSVDQAAREMRVDAWMITALEADDYEQFGAPVFAKGHLRKYAAVLGIPPDDIMVSYYRSQGASDAPPLVAQAPETSAGSAGSSLLAGALIGAAVLVFGVLAWLWFSDSRQDGAPAQTTAPGPSGSARLSADPAPGTPPALADPGTAATVAGNAGDLSAPAGSESSGQSAAPGEPGSAAVPADTGSGAQAAGAESRAPATGSAEVVAAAAPAPVLRRAQPAGANVEPAAGQSRLVLNFQQESWVEVRDAAGQRLLYGLGGENTSEAMVGTAPFEVFLGRAPGVSVEVDGQPFTIPADDIRGNVARFLVSGQ